MYLSRLGTTMGTEIDQFASVALEMAQYYQHMIWQNVTLMLVSFFLNPTLQLHSRTEISYSSFLAKDKHKFSWVNSSALKCDKKMDFTLFHFFFQAVARHSCMELLNVHEAELKSEIVNNEDATMKPKLRRLDQINKILAHRPWAIKKHHIKVSVWRLSSTIIR